VVSPGTLISSTNKTDRHDITEILLKMALNTISHIKLKTVYSGSTVNVSEYNPLSISVLEEDSYTLIR
jgi:hypothetical protein